MSDSVSIDYSRIDSSIAGAVSVINSHLQVVAQQVDGVSTRVDAVAQEQANTKQLVESVLEEFREYVEKDDWTQTVVKAKADLLRVHQELEKDFGHHHAIRLVTIGILQATDSGSVRKDTIYTQAEEHKIHCPRYWLAPALLALAAWITNNRDMANSNIAEAIANDDSKTSLFFALVCRRARRTEACMQWLRRYFQLQNPMAIDREVAVMLDALANGVFGGAALDACSKVVDEWLKELEQQAGFADEQRKRWAELLDVKKPSVAVSEYPTLRKYSPTWPRLEATLAAARRNQVVQSYFEQLFTGEIVVAPRVEEAVDDLLFSPPPHSGLLERFEDLELPLRRKAARLEIIMKVDEEPGRARDKKGIVDKRFQAEQDALQEQTNFAAILTNSAMLPEKYGTTRASQRYAVSRSRDWIIAGFNDLVARDRALVPVDVEIGCGSWKGTSRDGLNEQQLSADLHLHYADRIEQAVNAVKLSGGAWAALIIGGLLGLVIASSGSLLVGLLIMAGAGAYFYFQYKNLDNVRQQTRATLEKERDDATRILKAALAELTDLRRETAQEDGKADDVVELLKALSSPQFVLKRPEQSRTVMA